MHKYKLRRPKDLIKAIGGSEISKEEIIYCNSYAKKIKCLSKNNDTFEATPEQAISQISSNHPKRMIQVSLIPKLMSRDVEKIEHAYSVSTYKPDAKEQVLIAGDSHAEFFSRIPWNSRPDWSHACLWTGATTCLGFATDSSSIGMICSTLKSLNPEEYKKFKLILSFGEIDIRHLFYSMIKVRKFFDNPKQYINFIKPQLVNKIEELRKLESVQEIGIIQPTPTTSTRRHGAPVTVEELKKYYQIMGEHPVLGTTRFRAECWEVMCDFIKEFCSNNSLAYIERSKESYTQSSLLNPRHTHDGCHLSSQKMLEFQYDNLKLIAK